MTQLKYTVAIMEQSFDLNLIKTFVTLADTGSFTQAALILKQPKSRVSRSIAKLEKELNTQLVRRTTRQTVLTSNGENFYKSTKQLISDLGYQISIAGESDKEISGSIRITAPEDMSNSILPSLIKQFQNKYPKVQIQIHITNHFVDLVKENMDIAFRIGNLKDSNLIQKKLIPVQLIMVASPQYLKSRAKPTLLKDLKEHSFIPFHLYTDKEEFKNLDLKPCLISDSFQLSLAMALEANGITMLPDFFAKKYLDNNRLERVIGSWAGTPSVMQLVYSPTKQLPPQVRAFIDFTAEQIKKD